MHVRTVLTCALVVLAACGAGAQERTTAAEVAAEWSDLLPNPRQPQERVLAGGQPSPRQLEAAKELGFKTIINLRVPGERGTAGEAEKVEALGMRYVSIPVQGAEGLTQENAQLLAEALEQADYPVMVHCGSGNRVGALFALEAFYLGGKSLEEAIQIGLDSGLTRLEPALRARLASP